MRKKWYTYAMGPKKGLPVVLTCLRCQYQWLPRVVDPRSCPECRSKHWATVRGNRQGMRPGT